MATRIFELACQPSVAAGHGREPKLVGPFSPIRFGLIVGLMVSICGLSGLRSANGQDYFAEGIKTGFSQTLTGFGVSGEEKTYPLSRAIAHFVDSSPENPDPSATQDSQDSPADAKNEPGQDSGKAITSELEKRLAEIEKQLTKAKEAEEKKKEEDASKPSVKLRGRLHADANWFGQDSENIATVGDIQDGTYFRRARLGVDGKAFETTEFRLEMDFAGSGRPTFTDLYGKVVDLPRLGSVQLGHFREPFSLEALSSSNFNPFMERAVFDEGRNWGIMAANYNESRNTTWAVGLFRDGSDDFGNDIGDMGERAITSRVTWLPFYDEPSKGRYFFEVGASYSYRAPDNRFLAPPGGPEVSNFRIAFGPPSSLNEPGVGSVPAFVSINLADVTYANFIGFETTWNIGSLNFQAEFDGALVNRYTNPNPWVHAGYIQASYFLTGESRQWDRKNGYWGRQQVFENFFRVQGKDCRMCCGHGAWEIAARWNYVDLNDTVAGLFGGYQDISTFGLNWYFSPYMRMMFDYSFTDLHDPDDGQSACQLFATRLDVSF